MPFRRAVVLVVVKKYLLRFRRLLAFSAIVSLLALGLFLHAKARLVSPAPTLLLRDRHGVFLAEIGSDPDGDAGYWELTSVPAKVEACTLAAEDRHFWRHPGVDPVAVVRAFWQNVHNGHRISGASTLAMQVARMQSPGRRGYFRKITESVTALAITVRFGRREVLRHYLRLVPYGNRIRGVGYAARRYLDKPVEDLSWAEAAFLAALPQAPGRMNPLSATGRHAAIERGKRILARLSEDGTLPVSEYEEAKIQIEALTMPIPERRPDSAMHAVLHLDAMLQDPAVRAKFSKRPLVDTTLDGALQEEVSWRAWSSVRAWEAQGAGNAAVVVIDPRTREVLAWVGSTDYFDKHHAGAIDYAQVRRSPGSTLKPFFYAHALDRGVITPATILDDLHASDGGVVNADPRFLGPLLPRVALSNSRNTTAVEVLERTGLDESQQFLGRLDLHDGSAPASDFGLGLAIGNEPVTLENLVRAYGALAGGGMLQDLVWYRGQPVAEPRRVISEDASRQVALFLSDPEARLPTFQRMGTTEYSFPVAVKTGTSSNYRDSWTMAWSKDYLVGVWVGHPDWRPMNGLSGYRAAATLARQVMIWLHRDEQEGGMSDVSFPPPRGAQQVRVCALTGKRATDACDKSYVEWFTPGTAPVEDCDAHVQRAVDVRDGLLATGRTPPAMREVRSFVSLGPRYADWQTKAGLPRPPEEISPLAGTGADAISLTPPPRSRVAARAGTPSLTARAAQNPNVPRLESHDVALKIASPRNGSHLLRDPETPATMATLSLEAVVDPPSRQIVWYVDGAPWQVVAYPYAARWPILPGPHTFQARLPSREDVSPIVKIDVE